MLGVQCRTGVWIRDADAVRQEAYRTAFETAVIVGRDEAFHRGRQLGGGVVGAVQLRRTKPFNGNVSQLGRESEDPGSVDAGQLGTWRQYQDTLQETILQPIGVERQEGLLANVKRVTAPLGLAGDEQDAGTGPFGAWPKTAPALRGRWPIVEGVVDPYRRGCPTVLQRDGPGGGRFRNDGTFHSAPSIGIEIEHVVRRTFSFGFAVSLRVMQQRAACAG